MTTALILDIAVLAVLLCFIIGGIRVGFVRSLCSFLAVFVAFFGAALLARALTPVLTELVTPYALPAIIERLEGGDKASEGRPEADETADVRESAFLSTVLGLPDAWDSMIEKLSTDADNVRQPFTSPSQALATYILKIIVFGAVFLFAFLLLLILWKLFSRSLDLVAKLPVLNFCNRGLGALLGLVKGLLLLFILRWALCDLTGFLPAALLEETLVFQWLAKLLAAVPLGRFLLYTKKRPERKESSLSFSALIHTPFIKS